MKTSKLQNLFFLLLLFMGGAILAFSFIKQSQNQIDKTLSSGSSIPVDQHRQVSINEVPLHSDYQLPHPGILPSNPLYPLKMVRDRISLTLTLNPEKKRLLLLHYADKRIAAARMLLISKHFSQSIETATKAEIYLFKAIKSSQNLPPEMTSIWFDTLKEASLKHEEIIEQIRAVNTGNNQIDHLHENIKNYQQEIESLSGKPFNEEQASPSGTATPSAEPYL